MKPKQNITIEAVYETLKENLSSHISIKHKKILRLNRVEVAKNSMVGVYIYVVNGNIKMESVIPGFVTHAFFGGLAGHAITHNARQEFYDQIQKFLIDKFYEED